MTCQLSTGINATAKLGALSETKMPDEGDEKRPTLLGLGTSSEILRRTQKAAFRHRDSTTVH